ncbi:hypothetical protein XBP1_2480030 [Xenorhabdus bovienii str. puntauvense]|uniref:Uncharacterized protein n=4 Tax=Xenorhabdus bovienii TaxID=40576 RepID=A0A077NPW3_XENBV|nr:hypothetical protein XBFFL1_2260030 [Xenorhabdus bovienii str. feltiae Florida]CDG97138.1 hypothetical protein XBP1_2480030 [Xenorhabdus bovienii str. puntauvense]CDH02940.1 hypothetical protein XBFM1_50022 [Xenorhabdus bovienii str. feltiae Moldova]CDH04142.1 hypothetical protein XBO1_1040045 [Xenorhabdus bovienii str. oregonense]CDH23487.1 hypothetical protein XBKB1_180054 [Xenorhabdus bovienii str. kraussei Becker Underwood]
MPYQLEIIHKDVVVVKDIVKNKVKGNSNVALKKFDLLISRS